MLSSFLFDSALSVGAQWLTQHFAGLRFTESLLRQSAPTGGSPPLAGLLCVAPEEIRIEILSWLDGFDLLRCQEVNRYFHKLIHHSKLLQYKILLAKAHYHDGPRLKDDFLSTSAARTSLLQTHIDGWRNIRHNSEALSLPLSSCKHFAQGVLAWADGRTIHVFELPSSLRRTPSQLREFKLGFEAVGICINPAQDLLILVECLEPEPPSPDESATRTKRTAYLHFKTLSDGGTHPKATRTVPLLVREPGIEMRCSGNLLALAYLQPETPLSPDMRFEIVDWKQGRRLMLESDQMGGDLVVAPFFLTQDLVLAFEAGPISGELVIYHISSGGFEEIVSLTVSNDMVRGTLTNIAISGSSPADAALSPPFAVDDDCRVVHVLANTDEFWDDEDDSDPLMEDPLRIEIAVPVHHILSLAEAHKRPRDGSGTCGSGWCVPFEEWTAKNAAVNIYRSDAEPMPTAVHGSRIATLYDNGDLVAGDFRPDLRHWVEKPAPDNASLISKSLLRPTVDRPNLESGYRSLYTYETCGAIPHLGEHEVATEIFMDEEHMIITKINYMEESVGDPAQLVIMSVQSQAD